MGTYAAAASIPATDKDVPLELFGGLNTELNPSDLPEGGSPANQDVEFLPGSCKARRGLHGDLTAPATGNIPYLKTYIQPNNAPLNLFQDSTGALYKQDPIGAPGGKTLLRQGIAGTYIQSVTAFGREYIATSDTQVGADIPLQYDGTNLDRVSQDGPGAPPVVSDALLNTLNILLIEQFSVLNIASAIETNGTLITVTTTAAHGLFVNDQVLVRTGNQVIDNNSQPILIQEVASDTSFSYEVGVTNVPAQSSGTVQRLAVTVQTAAPHGLLTGDAFTISGTNTPYDNNHNETVNGSATGLTQIEEVGTTTVATITTATPHGLQPGNLITVDVGNASYDQSGTLFPVLTVDSPTVLTYDTGISGLPTLTTGGTFTVTQRINLNTPPMWTVRTVRFADQITFNAVSTSAGTLHNMGTFRGGGLSSEGAHKCVVMFKTRQGYITAPSPPVTFGSAGSRRFSVTNIPIGPPNVLARVLGFTGSGGDNFFAILETPMGTDVTGARVPIGTSTIINDNTTTSATFDIADNTLFASTGIDIPGNNLFAQVVLGPCLGFASYASRLIPWGEREKVQNLVSMGFGGGYLSGVLTDPLGWSVIVVGGTLVNSDVGMAWKINGSTSGLSGLIRQSAYQDWTGAFILNPTQKYSFRLRAFASNAGDPGNIVATLSSVSAGFAASATIPLSGVGTTANFYEAAFNLSMPLTIPSDMVLSVGTQNQTTGHWTQIDEMEIIPQLSPLMNNLCRGSYVNNPEAFDGVTGVFGPADDPSPMQCMTLIRQNLVMHTQEGTYSTIDNDAEPSGWNVNNISRAVGALSFRSCDANKTGTGDAGEEWECVATKAGAYVFAGGEFYKISQEIQSVWDRINWNARGTVWIKNSTQERLIFFGVPLDSATTPSVVLAMNYRGLDTGQQIGTAPSIRIGFSGKKIATDYTRKWTVWNLPMQSGQIIYLDIPRIALGGTVGQFYYLDPAKLTDDDYGQKFPSWTSYFFVSNDQELAFGLGGHMKLMAYIALNISGVGQVLIVPYADSLLNAWTATPLYPLPSDSNKDLEWPLNVTTERCAFKVAVFPAMGQTDVDFNLTRMCATVRMNAWMPVRGHI